MPRLMAVAMGVLATGLAVLPHLATVLQVMGWAVLTGVGGGFVMVLFFGYWARAYGRRDLGQIQGVAQALTVVASAVGPLLLAQWVARTGIGWLSERASRGVRTLPAVQRVALRYEAGFNCWAGCALLGGHEAREFLGPVEDSGNPYGSVSLN